VRSTTRETTQEIQRTTANEELFRLLVESVHDYAIFALDPEGNIATWNVGAQRIKGYSAAEMIGRHFSTFYPTEDVAAGKCEHELEVAARVGRFEDEGWRVRKDGTRFWANVVISAMRDPDGVLVGFSKVTRDLTERKRAEEEQAARLAAEERFRMLVDSVRDYALFMLDTQGRVATWNIGAARIKGYSADEIIGKHLSVFYPLDDVAAGKCEMELEGAERDGRFEDEGWRVRKDGSQFWANVVISGVRDRTGTLVGFSKVTRDLTDRKRAQAELAARLAAEQSNRAKDEFLAMLGHELRNPMAPILTALQLMKLRGDESKEQQVIERQVLHMIHLVDDLLDIARITRGKIELKPTCLDLRAVMTKAIEVASPLMEQRRQHFEIAAPSYPLTVEVDEARLTQVFANLLTNAAKYTPVGGHIFVSFREARDDVVIEIRDDGEGISAGLLPNVFDRFVQGTQGVERSTGGLGLGLTLVRTLVELHGGKVTAHSAGPGTGSTFTVTLRSATKGALPVKAPTIRTAIAANPQRILLVDDNDDARMLLGEALTEIGHDVRTAGDPVEALELARQFKPTIAVLDIGLPVMDGYELAARVRAELQDSAPRLIALTGYGQADDLARSRSAGFDIHLVKPVDVKRLLDSIVALSQPV
jgi:PAS domain S-box-containing protein